MNDWDKPIAIYLVIIFGYGLGFLVVPVLGMLGILHGHVMSGM